MQIRLAAPGRRRGHPGHLQRRGARSTNTFDMVPRSAGRAEWPGIGRAPRAVIPAGRGRWTTGTASRARLRLALGLPGAPGLRRHASRTRSTSTRPAGQGGGPGPAGRADRPGLAHGFHSVIARIAGDNEASIGLHQACGFELVGVEREVGRKHRVARRGRVCSGCSDRRRGRPARRRHGSGRRLSAQAPRWPVPIDGQAADRTAAGRAAPRWPAAR